MVGLAFSLSKGERKEYPGKFLEDYIMRHYSLFNIFQGRATEGKMTEL